MFLNKNIETDQILMTLTVIFINIQSRVVNYITVYSIQNVQLRIIILIQILVIPQSKYKKFSCHQFDL